MKKVYHPSEYQAYVIRVTFKFFIGFVGLLTLAACNGQIAEPATISATTSQAEVSESMTNEPNNNSQVEAVPTPTIQITQTAISEPTVEPTPDQAELFNLLNMREYAAEVQTEILTRASEAGLDLLAYPDQFNVISPWLIEIVSESDGSSAYNVGDVLAFYLDGGFTTIAKSAIDDSGQEVFLSEEYSLQLINAEGETVDVYTPSTTQIFWVADSGPSYAFALIDGLGNPLEKFVAVETKQQIDDLLAVRAAFPDTDIIEIVYDDNGVATALDVDGQPVATRALENSQWAAYIDPQSYVFGPEGDSLSTLFGEEMPDTAHTLVFQWGGLNGQPGYWLGEVPDEMIGEGARLLTPQEFAEKLTGILNTTESSIELDNRMGDNGTISYFTAAHLLGARIPPRIGNLAPKNIDVYLLTFQFFIRNHDGELVTVVADMGYGLLFNDENRLSTEDFRHYFQIIDGQYERLRNPYFAEALDLYDGIYNQGEYDTMILLPWNINPSGVSTDIYGRKIMLAFQGAAKGNFVDLKPERIAEFNEEPTGPIHSNGFFFIAIPTE